MFSRRKHRLYTIPSVIFAAYIFRSIIIQTERAHTAFTSEQSIPSLTIESGHNGSINSGLDTKVSPSDSDKSELTYFEVHNSVTMSNDMQEKRPLRAANSSFHASVSNIESNNNTMMKDENLTPPKQQQLQCPIPENRTAMDASWLKFVTKEGWLPKNTSGIPLEGAFYDKWHPTMDCPSAFRTLQWKEGGDSNGELKCPPGAPMWTFHESSTTPAISTKNSTRIICPESGIYSLARGWGVLCQNSMRLRPSRSDAAIARAQGLMKKRKEQGRSERQELISSNSGAGHNNISTTTTAPSTSTRRPPHILIYMQDAVSRPALHRNLKALKRTIQDISDRGADLGTNIYEFHRHHSVGGSTIRNLTPMLTGLLLKNIENHKNSYEAWAFEEFRRMGYISINSHNFCSWHSVNYGTHIGVNAPEHYFPHQMEDIGWFGSAFCSMQQQFEPRIPISEVQANCARTPQDTDEDCKPSKEKNQSKQNCLGGRSRSSMMIEHYLKIREDHKDDDVPTFAFMQDDDLHIEDITSLHRYDNDKAAIFQTLEKSGVLRDTVIVYVSDHGSQQKITTTTLGANEYKLPFWYLAVPEEVLIERGKGVREALEANQHVLTSQPDVHETMLDLAGGRGMGDAEWWQQHGHDPDLNGNSVLEALPYNRTCADAGIPALECSCGDMITEELAPGSNQWRLVQTSIIPKIMDHMNDELEKHKLISMGVCRKLTAKNLLSASSRPVTVRITSYTLRFSVESTRSEPMEFFAEAGKGNKNWRKAFLLHTVNQSSRFAHWIEQCSQDVMFAGGDQHFCDCVKPPVSGGLKFNETQQ